MSRAARSRGAARRRVRCVVTQLTETVWVSEADPELFETVRVTS
jgi:hypothetical protein